MEITVLCEKVAVATAYSSNKVEVMLEGAGVDSVVVGLLDNGLDGVDKPALINAIGVDTVLASIGKDVILDAIGVSEVSAFLTNLGYRISTESQYGDA